MKTIFDPRYVRLVNALKERRIAVGLTQAQAAQRLGRPRSWTGKVEQKERRLDVLETVDLADVYGLSGTEIVNMLSEGKRA